MKIKINLKNNEKKLLVLSLPYSNHYQRISNLKIKIDKKYEIIEDKKWGNQILIIDKNSQLSLNFNLKSYSIKTEINTKFNLYSYSKINIPKIYLTPNRFINGEDPKIKKLAKTIVGKEKNLKKIIEKLYYFTLSYLTYGKPTDGLYSYKQALTEKITDCGGFSTFLASLLQSQGIPCRLVVGFIVSNNIWKKILSMLDVRSLMFHDLFMHVWLEVLLPDGSWFPLDSSIEWRRNKRLTKKQGGFGYIPTDRLVTSFGCDFKIKINNKNYQIDLLQKPNLLK
ncbi:MAG: transglutaminase-like domain-containing protein [Microgenomates group bacterium]